MPRKDAVSDHLALLDSEQIRNARAGAHGLIHPAEADIFPEVKLLDSG